MSRTERFYFYFVPRILGLFLGALYYLLLTRIVPYLAVWLIDSGNLKVTPKVIEVLKFIDPWTDPRSPILIFFVLWIASGISATATQKLLVYYKGTKSAEPDQKTDEEQAEPDKNAHMLTWKGIG